MNLYSEYLYLDDSIIHDRVHQMIVQDLRPEYTDLRTVASENSDRSYLVGKVSVLEKPYTEADVVADRVNDIYVCGCDDYHFNRSKGFENGDMKVTELGKCKHIIMAYRTEKAKQDDRQTEL